MESSYLLGVIIFVIACGFVMVVLLVMMFVSTRNSVTKDKLHQEISQVREHVDVKIDKVRKENLEEAKGLHMRLNPLAESIGEVSSAQKTQTDLLHKLLEILNENKKES